MSPGICVLILSLALGASTAADGYSTMRVLNRGGHEIWSAWIIGRHPSAAHLAVADAVGQGVSTWLLWRTEHSRRRWLRVVARLAASGLTAGHVVATARADHLLAHWR